MSKFYQITWLFIFIETFNQTKNRKKKVFILAKDVYSKKKFEIKAKNNVAWNRPFFGSNLIQAVEVKLHGFFYKMFILLQNIYLKTQPFKG